METPPPGCYVSLGRPVPRNVTRSPRLRDNTWVLRNQNLIPLSRQHQHALALCVRLDRAIRGGEVDVAAWQAEIGQIFQQEIAVHLLPRK